MNFYNYIEDKIKNKKVLILGLGKEGLSTLKLLSKLSNYKRIGVADNSKGSFDNVKSTEFTEKIVKHLGYDYLNSIDEYDIVFKSPGIVLDKNTDISKISSQMQVFTEYYREQITGVTGTKGKSTTASLLYHILKENNINTVLCGNIGIPVFDIIDDIKKDTQIVVEMSCHQLEYMSVSPKNAVLLNLYEEHLDHYGTYEKYCLAKYNIFKYMKETDNLILTEQLMNKKNDFKLPRNTIFSGFNNKKCDINIIKNGFYKNNILFKIPENINLLGVHNIYNIACVYKIAEQFGIDYDNFIISLKKFKPLPHRLEYIGNFYGIDFYNDSISTMGESTVNAIKSVKNTGSVLIGGMDRGIDYTTLIDFIIENNEYTYILMEDTGSRIYNEIKEKLNKKNLPSNIVLTKHIEEAVDLGFKLTEKNKACILSPAAASYGIFKNFEHRGDVFCKLVEKYKK